LSAFTGVSAKAPATQTTEAARVSLMQFGRGRLGWRAESRSVRRLRMTGGPLESGLARRITGEDVCQHRRINGFGEVRVESRIERALFVV